MKSSGKREGLPAGAAARLTVAMIAAACVGACSTPHPFVMQGDANTVQVNYAGDLAAATAVARRHCAAYERVPRLLQVGPDDVYFACVQH